jgi:rsbT co-antagonist protein RsbR
MPATARPTMTEAARAAHAARWNDAHYRTLVDSVTDYAIITLDSDGRIATWNKGAERIIRYAPEEITGQNIALFFSPEHLEAGVPRRHLELAARDGRFEDEGWRVRKDGTKFWASVMMTALRDENGTLLGFGKVIRDMTAQKQAEATIARQSQEILDVATPVVQIWDGVVAAPLIGALDRARTERFMERLLNKIVETNSPVALVDITGVPAIDTQTAQHLVETVTAVRLLGAQVVLTGVRPALAQTLVHLGIDLSQILTRSSLSAGLRVAFNLLNIHVSAVENNRV